MLLAGAARPTILPNLHEQPVFLAGDASGRQAPEASSCSSAAPENDRSPYRRQSPSSTTEPLLPERSRAH